MALLFSENSNFFFFLLKTCSVKKKIIKIFALKQWIYLLKQAGEKHGKRKAYF